MFIIILLSATQVLCWGSETQKPLRWQVLCFMFMVYSLLPHFPLNILKAAVLLRDFYIKLRHIIFLDLTFLFLYSLTCVGADRQTAHVICHKLKRGLISISSIVAINKHPCIKESDFIWGHVRFSYVLRVATHKQMHTHKHMWNTAMMSCIIVLYIERSPGSVLPSLQLTWSLFSLFTNKK